MPVLTRAVAVVGLHAKFTTITEQLAATGTCWQEVPRNLEELRGMSEAPWAYLSMGVALESPHTEWLDATHGQVDDLIAEVLY